MKCLIPGVLAAILAVVTPVAIQAATVRYSFDVIDSVVGYSTLTNDTESRTVAPGSAEYAAFTAAHHAQAAAIGQTGRVSLEFDILDYDGQPFPHPAPSGASGIAFHDATFTARCLSGFLCGLQDAPFSGGGGVWEAVFDGSDLVREEFSFVGSYLGQWRFDPVAGTGRGDISDDGRVFGGAFFGGDFYFWEDPNLRFTLATVERTLVHAPLPASPLLLASGLIPLLAFRRRRVV